MPKQSAGLLMFRRGRGELQVLLVHPGGPFWKNKDLGAWTIPKGEHDAGEEALVAAAREFREETGIEPRGPFIALTPVKQAGGKVVAAWAFEGDSDAAAIRSNTFSLEWPRGSGRFQDFPEVDRAAWFSLDEARRKVLRGQVPLLEELASKI
ncbi:MAG TPA: NUDIX domain-containing protein [Methylomirabilota bacterium]|jgi:predicted NUDIX family NTP pyrophosphohydrolase|nr:NUDIX domain-containing protein [Methylomirabilota bacterium]